MENSDIIHKYKKMMRVILFSFLCLSTPIYLSLILKVSSISEITLLIFLLLISIFGIFLFKDMKLRNKIIYSFILISYISLFSLIVNRDMMYVISKEKCSITFCANKVYIVEIEGNDIMYIKKNELIYDIEKRPILYESFIEDIFGNRINKGYRIKSTLMRSYANPKLLK